jgi:hypothetical protein
MAVGVQADPSKGSAAWWEAHRQTMTPYEFLRECLPGGPHLLGRIVVGRLSPDVRPIPATAERCPACGLTYRVLADEGSMHPCPECGTDPEPPFEPPLDFSFGSADSRGGESAAGGLRLDVPPTPNSRSPAPTASRPCRTAIIHEDRVHHPARPAAVGDHDLRPAPIHLDRAPHVVPDPGPGPGDLPRDPARSGRAGGRARVPVQGLRAPGAVRPLLPLPPADRMTAGAAARKRVPKPIIALAAPTGIGR